MRFTSAACILRFGIGVMPHPMDHGCQLTLAMGFAFLHPQVSFLFLDSQPVLARGHSGVSMACGLGQQNYISLSMYHTVTLCL